jgi:hypothetical protein
VREIAPVPDFTDSTSLVCLDVFAIGRLVLEGFVLVPRGKTFVPRGLEIVFEGNADDDDEDDDDDDDDKD